MLCGACPGGALALAYTLLHECVAWVARWLASWLSGWLAAGLTRWLAECLVGWLAGWLAARDGKHERGEGG